MHDVLSPLIEFFEAILLFFHDTIGFGWGWSIVALTVLVRAALLPLTLKQFKSMQNMVRFQPEIKRLQEKYKNDRERLNQEMMKFYRENKVNPFASCLPLVAQLPVFLALFYMLQDDLRLDICPDINPPGTTNPQPCGDGGEASFLFIPDLTDKATGGVLIALIVLYVGSQLLSTILMSTATGPDAAHHLPRAAVRVRDLRDQLPGRPARLLDHDEPVDHRPADHRAEAPRADATTLGRRGTAADVDHGPDAARPRRQAADARRPPPESAASSGARERQRQQQPRSGEGAQAERAPALLAAKEEEAIRETEMSEQETSIERVRELLEQVNTALGLEAEVEVSEEGGADPRRAPR